MSTSMLTINSTLGKTPSSDLLRSLAPPDFVACVRSRLQGVWYLRDAYSAIGGSMESTSTRPNDRSAARNFHCQLSGRVSPRQSGARSHSRKADAQVERPNGRRPRWAVPDPSATVADCGSTSHMRHSILESPAGGTQRRAATNRTSPRTPASLLTSNPPDSISASSSPVAKRSLR